MLSSLKNHFLNLYSMALADTDFDESEIVILYKIGEDRGVPKADIDKIILNPANAKFVMPERIDEKIAFLYDYAKMILADGKVLDYEIKSLEKFCLKFDFKEENISGIVELLMEAAKNNINLDELLTFVDQTA